MKLLLQVLFVLIALKSTLGTDGFDISIFSGAVSQDTFTCMKNAGNDFAILQAWNGGYKLNTNYAQNIRNAKAAGIQYVDIYAFVCPNCAGNTPAIVAGALKASLPSDFNGMLWLDIEPCSG